MRGGCGGGSGLKKIGRREAACANLRGGRRRRPKKRGRRVKKGRLAIPNSEDDESVIFILAATSDKMTGLNFFEKIRSTCRQVKLDKTPKREL